MSPTASDIAKDGMRVRWNPRVARELISLAIDGMAALPRRGIELGGVLTGGIQEGEVRIDGFEEVPCEHRYGPSYTLSDVDRERLRLILAGDRKRGPTVGFFRTFTSREPVIEDADREMVRQFFPQGDFVYVLVRTVSAQNCTVQFRVFHNGELSAAATDAPSLFNPEVMEMEDSGSAATQHLQNLPRMGQGLPAPIRISRPAERAGGGALPRPARPALHEVPRFPGGKQWSVPKSSKWTLGLVCLVVGAASSAMYDQWANARSPRWAELHLDAEPHQGGLEVSWDAGSAPVQQANRGLLLIQDGLLHREVRLSAGEVQAGRYTYEPLTADVGLRLMLYSKGQPVGDSVRIAAMPDTGEAAAPLAEALGPLSLPLPGLSDDPPPPDRETRPAVVPANAAKPPEVAHAVHPGIPAGIRSRLSRRVVVPVDVRVDASGRVVGAKAVRGSSGGLDGYLADIAQDTARNWRFTPSRSANGENVAGSTTIYIEFRP